MIGILFFFLIVGLAALLISIALYNQLVKLQTTRENSIHQITPQLHKRFAIASTLREALKNDTKRKKNIQLALKSRSQAKHPEEQIVADNQLQQFVDWLLEDNPDISPDMRSAIQQLTNLSVKIIEEKRFFNNITKERNARLKMFPTSVISKLAGFMVWNEFTLSDKEQEGISAEPKFS